MSAAGILLPGDIINPEFLPTSQKRRIGPGIRELDEHSLCTIGGQLEVDFRKKSALILTPTARYVPRPGDLIIAQVKGTSMDYYHLYITSHSPQAILPQLAFEGATKKTRPQLKINDLVYAKVVAAQKNMEIELSCVNPSTGKSEPDGLGPLTGGMIFDVSIGFAERLLKKQGVVVMEELGAKLQGGFEVAVGKNGKVWVDCPESGVRGICAIGKCLGETDDNNLTEKEQKRLVNRVLNEMSTG